MNLAAIFRDYEVQLDAQRQRDYELDAQEISRAERAKVTMADRLAAQMGTTLTVQISNGDVVRGELENLGLGWIQLHTDTGAALLPVASILWWEGGDAKAYVDAGSVARKLTLGYALRALAKAHQEISISHLHRSDLLTEGKIYAVGADACELLGVRSLSSHRLPTGELRTVPFSSIGVIRVR